MKNPIKKDKRDKRMQDWVVHEVRWKSELLSPLSKLFDAIFSLQCETIDGLKHGEVDKLQDWATLLASGRLESLQKYVQHS